MAQIKDNRILIAGVDTQNVMTKSSLQWEDIR